LNKSGTDVLLVSNINTIRYLTGFTGSSGLAIVTGSESWFLTDSRYTSQAVTEVSGFVIIECRNLLEEVTDLFRAKMVKRVGFESDQVTVATFNELSAALPGVELLPIDTKFATLRSCKDKGEIALLAKTAELASAALLDIIEIVRPETSERAVALALEFAMKRAGADDKAFDFIVASGTRGALPHGKASHKLINSGELITIDFGAVLDGYNSDETVTLVVGNPDERQKEIYSIVKDAHDMAIAAVKPGITCRELDSVARGYIEKKGYGSFFGHGLGHGIGLEVHEQPTVSMRSDTVVEEGMVFTIEPGIYIPGWGGVRIEDTVSVTADGCRCLTKVPKEMMIV
jgi:Xaa-Pro aminopeptidase